MFTTDNTNGFYSDGLLDEMNAALTMMLDDADGDDWTRQQNEKNFSDMIAAVARDGMSAEQIIAAIPNS